MRNYKNPIILKVFTSKSLTAGVRYISYLPNTKHLIIIDILIKSFMASFAFRLRKLHLPEANP